MLGKNLTGLSLQFIRMFVADKVLNIAKECLQNVEDSFTTAYKVYCKKTYEESHELAI